MVTLSRGVQRIWHMLTIGLQDIYQRSVQVESGPGGAADSSKKKFPWLAK